MILKIFSFCSSWGPREKKKEWFILEMTYKLMFTGHSQIITADEAETPVVCSNHFYFPHIFNRAPVPQSIFTILWSSFILTNQWLLLKTGFWILQIFKPCFCKSFGIGYKRPAQPSARTNSNASTMNEIWDVWLHFPFIFSCKIPEAVEWFGSLQCL